MNKNQWLLLNMYTELRGVHTELHGVFNSLCKSRIFIIHRVMLMNISICGG